jgi:hypothetical protein
MGIVSQTVEQLLYVDDSYALMNVFNDESAPNRAIAVTINGPETFE